MLISGMIYTLSNISFEDRVFQWCYCLLRQHLLFCFCWFINDFRVFRTIFSVLVHICFIGWIYGVGLRSISLLLLLEQLDCFPSGCRYCSVLFAEGTWFIGFLRIRGYFIDRFQILGFRFMNQIGTRLNFLIFCFAVALIKSQLTSLAKLQLFYCLLP